MADASGVLQIKGGAAEGEVVHCVEDVCFPRAVGADETIQFRAELDVGYRVATEVGAFELRNAKIGNAGRFRNFWPVGFHNLSVGQR